MAKFEPVPIMPRSLSNPIGKTRLLNRTIRATFRGIREVERKALEWFDLQPRHEITVNKVRYEYLISPEELKRFIASIKDDLFSQTNPAMTLGTETGYNVGTAVASENLAALTDEYTRTFDNIIHEAGYQYRIGLVRARIFEQMEGFSGETGADLARVLSNIMETGQSPLEGRRLLSERFGVSRTRAERIARTEILMALRRGRMDEADEARERLGVQTKMLWFSALSPTTRRWHAAKHGEVYTTQEVREFYADGSNAINCYLPGTKVQGRFVAGSKAHYSGDAFNIVTAGGRNLSITPNHPVMTDRGLVAAAELREGDNLVCDIIKQEDPVGPSTLNANNAYATIEQVFSSLTELGHTNTRRVRGIDFHGDGRGMNEHVDIVDVDRPLIVGGNASLFECLDNLKFKHANSVLGASFSSESLGLVGVDRPSPSLLGRFRDRLSVFLGCSYVSNHSGFSAISPIAPSLFKPSVKAFSRYANIITYGLYRFARLMSPVDFVNVNGFLDVRVSVGREPSSLKPFVNGSTRNPKAFGKSDICLSGFTSFDKVVNINRFSYTGHVYDLQEVSGLMVANNLISSNCKCAQQEALVDDQGNLRSKKLAARMAEQREGFVAS